MKIRWIKKILSVVLAGAMVICLSMAAGVPVKAYADEAEDDNKYVSDVFIAYGKSEKEAAKWLTDHGWEPVAGDFNAGKASFFDNNDIQDQNVAAVMGIKRTSDEKDAITDMAVMNMTGGYSLPQYQDLVNQKKAEINEFINNFQVVIDEYRANYNKEDNSLNKKRAQVTHDMLNKFYDGDPEDPVGVHDTGMKLGDFFLASTRQEGDENGGDLEQMMLESSGPAMLIVEIFLALGADPSEDTWLERASGLTGDELAENLVKYAPEAEGQDVAPSAVPQYLGQKYGDTAATLADQWSEIHEEMTWYETYSNEHDLWSKEDEDAEAYAARKAEYFKGTEDESGFSEDEDRYNADEILYNNLYDVAYEGDWGKTMGDFFNPADGSDYGQQDYFLPMAAALSPGQRAAMDFLSLNMLLNIGFGNEEALESAQPDIKEILGDAEEMDIFTGVNREAFRTGVAITSEALMEEHAGKGQAFDQIWDNTGIVAITSYAAAGVGIISMIAGRVMVAKGYDFGIYDIQRIRARLDSFDPVERQLARGDLKRAYKDATVTKMGVAGRWVMGIGGALLLGAAIVKGVQMWKYYQRTMKPIPRMIVDESDIVTYLTDEKTGKPLLDENGNQKKNIDFNTFEYYTAVKCNRPDVGEIGDWQDGVKEYKNDEHYCYDVADLNADMGQEWLALYTVKSSNKGDPVLADSLTLQYGKKDMPKGCKKAMHLFTYTNAVDLGDTAWAFNNKKKGVYFFWDEDVGAFAPKTASSFTAGNLAMASIGGLILGIAGATLVMKNRRRKDESEAA